MQNHLSLEIEIFAEELSALSSLLIITFNHETIQFSIKKDFVSFLLKPRKWARIDCICHG